jgi:hypothetical protein
MEQSEAGVFELPPSERQKLVERTQTFHVIKQIQHPLHTDINIWVCDCYNYYVHKWCRITAAHQHRAKLQLDSGRIPGGGNNTGTLNAGRKKSQRERDLDLLRQSKRKKQEMKQKQGL